MKGENGYTASRCAEVFAPLYFYAEQSSLQTVTAVLFLAAISAYDQGLIEDRDSVSLAAVRMPHKLTHQTESNARSAHAV